MLYFWVKSIARLRWIFVQILLKFVYFLLSLFTFLSAKHAPTRDGRYCIKCPDNANVTESGCKCLPETGSGYILIEREVDGKLLGTAKCVKCAPGSKPSLDRTQCEPCLYYPIIDGQNESCNCSNLIGGLCLPPNYKSDGFDGITFSPTSLRY